MSDSEEAWQTAIRNLTDREIDNVSEGDVTDFRLLQDIQFSDYCLVICPMQNSAISPRYDFGDNAIWH